MEILLLSLFIILFNLFIFIKFDKISENLFFFDKPDGKLKKHKDSVLLLCLIILLNLYLIIFILKYDLNSIIFTGTFLI